MVKTDTWEDDAAFLQTRVILFQVSLDGDTLTPLLRHEISVAIDLFTVALKLPEIDEDHFKVLRKTYEKVLDRWVDVHKDLSRHGRLLCAIRSLQSILCIFLLEDYSHTKVPSLANPQYKMISEFAGYIKNHRTLSASSDEDEKSNEGGGGSSSSSKERQESLYIIFIRNPCREMMVDENHVADMICWKVEGPPGAANTKLRRLIAQCDWDRLASLLFHDRQLMLDLFEDKKRSVGPSVLWTKVDYPVMLHMLDKTRKKYFQELTSPSTFTLTGHAKRMSAKTVPALDRISSQSTLCNDERGGSASWKSRASRLYKNLTQGVHDEARRWAAAGREAAGGQKLLIESEKE